MRFGQPGKCIQVNICLHVSANSMTRTSSSALNESSAKYFHIRYFLVLYIKTEMFRFKETVLE